MTLYRHPATGQLTPMLYGGVAGNQWVDGGILPFEFLDLAAGVWRQVNTEYAGYAARIYFFLDLITPRKWLQNLKFSKNKCYHLAPFFLFLSLDLMTILTIRKNSFARREPLYEYIT